MWPAGADAPLVATCSRGLEPVLVTELERLGVRQVEEGRGAVSFAGDLATVYRANLELRTAMRVLVALARGPVTGRGALYELAASVAWEDLFARGQTLAVEAVGRAPGFDNTGFAALVVKDAVVDRLRRVRGERPEVDRTRPDVGIHVHLGPEQTALSLDSTGVPLSRRGYRPHGGPAPLAEGLAAGVLLLAGYDGTAPLLDPMCGSGTIAAEAALIATRTAPGLDRHLACERWLNARPALLDELRREARARWRPAPAPVVARDVNPRALDAARRHLEAAGIRRWVRVEQADVGLDGLAPGWAVVTNPPYGVRLGDAADLGPLYERFGDALKRHAAGCTAWVLAGDRGLAQAIGLKPQRRIPLWNGPIECRLLRYDIVAGRPGRERPAGAA